MLLGLAERPQSPPGNKVDSKRSHRDSSTKGELSGVEHDLEGMHRNEPDRKKDMHENEHGHELNQ